MSLREPTLAYRIFTALRTYRFCTNGSGSAGVLGLPTIGYGPGREETAHIVDEYLELEQLFTSSSRPPRATPPWPHG